MASREHQKTGSLLFVTILALALPLISAGTVAVPEQGKSPPKTQSPTPTTSTTTTTTTTTTTNNNKNTTSAAPPIIDHKSPSNITVVSNQTSFSNSSTDNTDDAFCGDPTSSSCVFNNTETPSTPKTPNTTTTTATTKRSNSNATALMNEESDDIQKGISKTSTTTSTSNTTTTSPTSPVDKLSNSMDIAENAEPEDLSQSNASSTTTTTTGISTSVPIDIGEPVFLSRLSAEDARDQSLVTLPEVDLVSHAGYVTVGETFQEHLFFWFFMAQQADESTPWILWLNGFPGRSSMTGLLWEHGPIGIRYASTSDDVNGARTVEVYKREIFWARKFHVLYLDSVINAGYSFSEADDPNARQSTLSVTSNLVKFLFEFLWVFPEFQDRDLYLGGSSYSAKYVISLAHWLHEEAKTDTFYSFIPVKGLLLNAPFFHPVNQVKAFLQAAFDFGAVSFADQVKHEDKLMELLGDIDTWGIPLSELIKLIRPSQMSHLNLVNHVTENDVNDRLIEEFMTSPRVRAAVHVGESARFKNFEVSVYDQFSWEFFDHYRVELRTLLNVLKVLIYSGTYDKSMSNSGLEESILSLHWSNQQDYKNATRKVWLDSGNSLNGFYTKAGHFCRAFVHTAGLYSGRDCPDITEKLISDFVEHGCVKE